MSIIIDLPGSKILNKCMQSPGSVRGQMRLMCSNFIIGEEFLEPLKVDRIVLWSDKETSGLEIIFLAICPMKYTIYKETQCLNYYSVKFLSGDKHMIKNRSVDSWF